ncbi:MAG: hypothetical protein ACYTG5_20735, partial [Planctomycetota bacterium]
MTNPRFGFDNLLENFSDSVVASSEDSNNPAASAYDWRPQTFWMPERTGNIATNGSFLLWSAGVSSAPDGFDLQGAGATVAQATPTDPIAPPYVAEITRSGADANLGLDISNGSPGSYVGSDVGAAVYLRTSVASQARISIDDGTAVTSSAFHTGGGTWERLEVTATIASGATQVRIQIDVVTTDGTVEADAFMAVELQPGVTTIPEFDEVGEATLSVFPADGQLLRNWTMELWSLGGASLPDRFEAAFGTPTTIARSQDAQIGNYAIEAIGAGIAIGEEITGDELESIRGKTAWFGAWCKTSTAARARVAFVFRYAGSVVSAEIAGTPGGGGRIHSGGGA